MPNIVVFVRPVPEDLNVAVSRRTGEPVIEGARFVINKWEKRAIELGLRLRDEHGGTVTVLTMSETDQTVSLRQALAMGADRAVLLSDKLFEGADTLATARVLSAAASKLRADLILTGGRTADRRAAGVGPMIAQMMNVPSVTFVTQVDLTGRKVRVKKRFGGKMATYDVPLPCLLSVSEETPKPRIATSWGVAGAFRDKDVQVWNRRDLDLHEESVGREGSPTRVRRFEKIREERKEGQACEFFEGDADEVARSFVRRMRARGAF
ncbi:MAG: electron transfer flavoprotein subunit beta/FixA family protein [Candidatus Thermoplasmatota archaeon]